MKEIRILDKRFREFITEEVIASRIEKLATQINTDLAGRDAVFLGILNGAFVFAADLIRKIDLKARVSFVKLASYEGTTDGMRMSKTCLL